MKCEVEHNGDMGMGHLWVNGWGIYHFNRWNIYDLMGWAFMT